ncbi:outer membrane protein assembly factor BamE [uncultured Limimaricola sp.]|uniref:outer membrane protein assembly factor BamE n=1 Tax=uncultured Limimaricola sp. TaxID=2211667 RepID=UPI0030FB0208
MRQEQGQAQMGMDTGRDKIGRGIRRGAALVGLAGLVACSPTERYHGYVPGDAVLETISLGESRDAVIEKAGEPTTAGALGDNDVYYVRSVFRHYGFLAPEEVTREVVAISFSPAGGVSNVERFDLSDGRIVPLTRRVTEDSVESGTFLRQLAGAAGNFDPSALINDE